MSNTIEILEEWQKHILATDAQINAVLELFPCDESPFIEAFERLQIAYTESIAEKVGDDNNWLMWYWLDNEMGNNGLEGGYDNTRKPLVSLQQLEQLILQCGQ